MATTLRDILSDLIDETMNKVIINPGVKEDLLDEYIERIKDELID